MCGHKFLPPPFIASLFLSLLSHNLIFFLPQTLVPCPVIGPVFADLFFSFTYFWMIFFFALFYQVFELQKQEASDEIAKLENEVFDLQERLQEEARFDISLITGSGRGRPKSDAFVAHVRCLLATGLLSLLYFLLFFLLSPLLSFHLSFCPDCSYMLFVDVCVCKEV